MKIAIHHEKGSFSDRWIQYCDINNIAYKIVDCYSNIIIEDLNDCEGLIWHWNQNSYKAYHSAKQITQAIEKKGVKIFPNTNTSWHYDDKVGQKYLLEAIKAPMVKSFVFYSENDALKWLESTTLPKVFKLRGGAGSVNVKLVETKRACKKLIKKSFNSGFTPINKLSKLRERFWNFRRDKNLQAFIGIFKGLYRCVIPEELIKFSHKQKGYVYFQEFIPNNNFDTRLVVIGNKCIGVRRYNRENDFRASGSGLKGYERELFDEKMVEIAFETSKKLGTQSLAFDFITKNNNPLIIEISYCYIMGPFYDDCHGYWDDNLKWHNKKINPQYAIIEDFMNDLKNK